MSDAMVIERETETREPRFERVIGSYTEGRPGPQVVFTAGLHGNEPAGTEALRRVLATLIGHRLPLRGRLLALTGNLAALERDQRYVSRDLNRGWTGGKIAELMRRGDRDESASGLAAAEDSEDKEQRALLRLFLSVFQSAKEPVVFLDLHSTSAGGAPFCAMADTLRNRKIAFALPVPVILGLEETIAGTMLSYLDGLGHASVVFEGGQNQDPNTVANDEAAVWITLVAAGCLDANEIPDYARHAEHLARQTRGIPHVVEVCHRHAIHDGDRYVMKPGYLNFTPIAKGEVLATDRHGEVKSGYDARILMPLYQPQGDDGYFVVRPVRRFWLEVSRWIRKLRLDVLLPLLPGVRNHPDRIDVLEVDPRVARYFVVEIFHLFGYRRSGEQNGKLLFARRRPEFRGLASATDPLDGPNGM